MIYLDNSATTYPKPKEVIDAVMDSFVKFGANPGRSGHSFSIKTALKIAEIRENLAQFVGAENMENVIFTSGATESLNLAILGSVVKGGHIVVTENDHNSVLRPVFYLKKLGLVEVSVAKAKHNNKLTAQDILSCIKPNTYLICINHISNVDGMISDIEEIGKICYEKCILLLVDGAQSVGHQNIDIVRQHIDFLAIAGHKGLYAPQGVGVLVVSSKAKLKPIKFGGTGTDSFSVEQPKEKPEAFESGTLATPAIIGLGAGLEFVKKNFVKIKDKLEDLTTCLHYELSQIKNLKIYTHPDNANGVLSFNIGNMQSTEVAQILDNEFNIMVRSGLHCAPLKHRALGTLETGTVRVSMSYHTTYNDISKLIKAVKIISAKEKV